MFKLAFDCYLIICTMENSVIGFYASKWTASPGKRKESGLGVEDRKNK